MPQELTWVVRKRLVEQDTAGGSPWKKFGKQLLTPMGDEGIANVGRTAMNLFSGSPKAAAVTNQYSPHLAAGYNKNLNPLAKEVVKKGTDWSKWILPASIGAGAYTAMAPVEGLDDTQGEYDKEKA